MNPVADEVNQNEDEWEYEYPEQEGEPIQETEPEKEEEEWEYETPEMAANDAANRTFWGEFYDMIFSPEESAFEQGLGQAMRGAIPTLAGLPKATYEAIKSESKLLGKKLPESLKPPKPPQNLTLPKEEQMVDQLSQLTEPLTEENLRKTYDELTDNQYLPKSEAQRITQEGASNAALILTSRVGTPVRS